MTVDVFTCSHVDGRRTLTLQANKSISELSEWAKSTFENFS